MKRIIFVLLVVLLSESGTYAQKYDFSAGIRAGLTDGFTFKKMMSRAHAYEGILHTNFEWQGALITVLYELHKTAFRLDNLYWVYGFGGHVGVFHGNAHYWVGKDIKTRGYFMNIGVDGILGLEWDIKEIPFTLGVDFKPTFDLFNSRKIYKGGAISARYLF